MTKNSTSSSMIQLWVYVQKPIARPVWFEYALVQVMQRNHIILEEERDQAMDLLESTPPVNKFTRPIVPLSTAVCRLYFGVTSSALEIQ